MDSLVKRVASGVAAALLILGVGYWWGSQGLLFFSGLAVLGGIFEFLKMAFPSPQTPFSLRVWFGTIACCALASLSYFHASPLILILLLSFFFAGSLWLARNRINNKELLSYLSMGSIGLVYFVGFPAMAMRALSLNHGTLWFCLLLLVVFIGDTFAYFGGKFLGKHPLMPALSPKKTIEGAFCGFLGSLIAGQIFLYLVLPEVPWYWTLGFVSICSPLAQSGDLFVSLIKRVADVKDSGFIMPGHGGILDRLDGVYIAAPVIYAFALLLQ